MVSVRGQAGTGQLLCLSLLPCCCVSMRDFGGVQGLGLGGSRSSGQKLSVILLPLLQPVLTQAVITMQALHCGFAAAVRAALQLQTRSRHNASVWLFQAYNWMTML